MPKVKVMETREDGRKFGWLGVRCGRCEGYGEVYLEYRDNDGPCPSCAGTGEAYGEIRTETTPAP